MKRLFVGVPVSEDVKEKVKLLFSQLKETGADFNFVSLENLHFTVKFLGDVEEEKVEAIKQQIASSLSAQKYLKIKLSKVGVFHSLDRINIVWIGAESEHFVEMMKTVETVLSYIKQNDFAEEVPHLTVARVKSGKNKDQLQVLLKKVKDEEFGAMIVDKVVLYESVLRPQGSEYKELATITFK